MMKTPGMHRRTLIGGILGGGVLAASTAWWLAAPVKNLQLSDLYRSLENTDWSQVQAMGAWNISTILQHCAQSIDYSIDGYPEQKPDWFKHSAGAIAFGVFSARGAMHHTLDEAIPGAPAINAQVGVDQALQTLLGAMRRFMAFRGPLAPHFAFGALSKAEYETAHAMHIFDELRFS